MASDRTRPAPSTPNAQVDYTAPLDKCNFAAGFAGDRTLAKRDDRGSALCLYLVNAECARAATKKTLRFGRSTITSTEWTQSQLSHSKPSGSLDFVTGDRGRHNNVLNFSRISCLCLGADRIYLIKVLVNQHHGDKEHRHPGSPPGHALIHALDRLDEYQDQEGETVIRRQILLNRT